MRRRSPFIVVSSTPDDLRCSRQGEIEYKPVGMNIPVDSPREQQGWGGGYSYELDWIEHSAPASVRSITVRV